MRVVVLVAWGSAWLLAGCAQEAAPADPTPERPPTRTAPVDRPWIHPLAGHEEVAEVSSGHVFTEGPVWIARRKVLRFTDTRTEEIFEVAEDGSVQQWRTKTGKANGLGVDAQGRMVVCEGGNRRVTRSVHADEVEVLAERWQGKRLNQPNDNVVGADDTIYFTDPHYGRGSALRELDFEGVFRIDRGGRLHLVSRDLERPNGIALSPDGKVLYVADNARSVIVAFDVRTDGATGPGRDLFACGEGPDGMAVDDLGHLYVATKNGIDVHYPDGKRIGTVAVPQRPTNCAFGAEERRVLFITARKSVYRVKLNVPGRP